MIIWLAGHFLRVVHCDHASILHRYGYMASQTLDARTLRWFYSVSNAMHCIGQTTSTTDEFHKGININDIERIWTLKIRSFVNFLRFRAATHTAPKWLEMDQNNLHMKFSALNVDFSAASLNLSGLKSQHTRASKRVPPKKWLLPLLAHVAWKRLQIRTDMLLIITSTSDRLSRGNNIDDFE